MFSGPEVVACRGEQPRSDDESDGVERPGPLASLADPLGIQPRVKSLRPSYTGLYPQCLERPSGALVQETPENLACDSRGARGVCSLRTKTMETGWRGWAPGW